MSAAETSAASETYLSPLDLVKANKFIGKVEPPVEGQQFATFELTIAGKPIKLQCKGVLGSEIKASQFNPGKLQLYFDVSGSGEMLFAAENTKKEIQQVLDFEFLPEFDVSVTSWVKNKAIYLSWPRQRGTYKPILINGKKVLF